MASAHTARAPYCGAIVNAPALREPRTAGAGVHTLPRALIWQASPTGGAVNEAVCLVYNRWLGEWAAQIARWGHVIADHAFISCGGTRTCSALWSLFLPCHCAHVLRLPTDQPIPSRSSGRRAGWSKAPHVRYAASEWKRRRTRKAVPGPRVSLRRRVAARGRRMAWSFAWTMVSVTPE